MSIENRGGLDIKSGPEFVDDAVPRVSHMIVTNFSAPIDPSGNKAMKG